MLGQLDTFIAFAVVILGVSMLVTVLNQMITALLGLRGTNLRWGLETLVEELDPALAGNAREIAEKVLQHPLISDSTWSKTHQWPLVGGLLKRWRLGSAIKVGELLDILRKLAAQPAPANGEQAGWQKPLTAFLAAHDLQAAQRMQSATTVINGLAPEVVKNVDSLIPQVAAQLRQSTSDLEQWFDSVMDRVSQRFALRLRLWTMVFSFVVAFTLHLDSSVVLRAMRSDPELRASLVASSAAMTKQAEQVLGTSVTSIYTLAAQRLKPEAAELEAAEIPALVNERDGAAWIGRNVTDAARRTALVTQYQQLVREELVKLTGELQTSAADIQAQLDAAGFSLVPDYREHHPGWVPDWFPGAPSTKDGRTWYRHFLGVLATAALLSLGAPFWFQVLKTASSLRPVVASREKEDRAQRAG